MGILIKDLTKAFGDKRIFNEFSCRLPSKGIIRVVGQSGAGKTTLLRMICGLDKDYNGSIENVGTTSILFQEYRLFPWLTALDNIVVASFEEATPQARDKAAFVLQELGFSNEAMYLKPRELSGGMKQRVSIARAILKDADTLILDEPTKELDSELSKKVLELIIEESKRRAVILVSHDSALGSIETDLIITVPHKSGE